MDGVELLTLETQLASPWSLASLLPTDHYARKNLGYLQALSDGAPVVFETDDDNEPDQRWSLHEPQLHCRRLDTGGWVNVYAAFGAPHVWPRGMPLDAVRTALPSTLPEVHAFAPVQQCLVDEAPDVDAVWRLVVGGVVTFASQAPVLLAPGTWCPFNSQCTWWWPVAYPLLYLPSYCTFRMTDIWRSLIAQRCLWAAGYSIAFCPPEAVQDRNEHDLLRDFEHEVPGYLGNRRLADALTAVTLEAGETELSANLRRCYEVLIEAGFFPTQELTLVDAWLEDLSQALAWPSTMAEKGADEGSADPS